MPVDYAALPSRELDAKCAELMGRMVAKDTNACGRKFILSQTYYEPGGMSIVWSQAGEWYVITGNPGDLFPKVEMVKKYSTDLNYSTDLEREIERRGLQHRYVAAIIDVCDRDGMDYSDRQYSRITATARERAEAFCRTVEIKGNA